MAGDWIKVECATPDKPEVWMMANTLGIDPDAVFGKVFRIWSWFDEHSEDGNAPSVTKMLLDRKVCVTGFCEVMLQAGWLVEEEGYIRLPNFDRHNGATAKKRANTAKRVAKSRSNAGKDKTETQEKQDCNAQGVTEALAKEEKRREEYKQPTPPTRGSLVETWEPSPETFELLNQQIPEPDFIKEQIAEFYLYWKDRETPKDSWNSAFYKSCMGQWNRNKHTWRKNREEDQRNVGQDGEQKEWLDDSTIHEAGAIYEQSASQDCREGIGGSDY